MSKLILEIESLDHEARGVAHHQGKTIFVEGALAGERVEAQVIRRKPKYEIAHLVQVQRASFARVAPPCRYFNRCGGCSMQHIDTRTQVAVKQRVLENNLWHIARVKPATVFRAIHGSEWAYRYRARLSVRHVAKKGGVLVGFHEKKSSYVADMDECHVLPQSVSDLLRPLRDLVAALSIRDRVPQIEVAMGDAVIVLVLRILQPLSPGDEHLVRQFAQTYQVQIGLQSQGPDSIVAFYPAIKGDQFIGLEYTLPQFNLRMPFRPTDFTQVNPSINRVLIARALALLEPQPDERIADLFCGLGNFTLPIATRARAVVGIEGSATLTRRAQDNALLNGLHNTQFVTANLFEVHREQFMALGKFDKALIDPPREGAVALVKVFATMGDHAPQRLVYVSCNPATLARDAAILVHEGAYELKGAGVVNMFPHTSHVESIALFEKSPI